MAEGSTDPLKVVEFYAGIGGFHFALKESGVGGEIVASIDINTNTTKVYSLNFPHTSHCNWNICGLTVEELDRLEADVFFLSPPCQPFTRQGNQLDNKDRRTDSFFHLMHILQEIRNPPQYVLMENVKGFESSHTRDQFVGILKSLEYSVREFLLSPSQFGVPNSRLRFYLLAKRKPLQFSDRISEWELNTKPSGDADKLIRYSSMCRRGVTTDSSLAVKLEPDLNSTAGPTVEQKSSTASENDSERRYDSSSDIHQCRMVSEYLEDLHGDVLERYLVPDKVLQKYATALDIVQEDCRHSCCFTKAYGNYAVGTGSILQHSLGETALQVRRDK